MRGLGDTVGRLFQRLNGQGWGYSLRGEPLASA